MKFTKMQGIGNDYVYVDCFKEQVKEPGKVSRFISDRHFGIGADGLILICPSGKADCRMEMYNADGSQGSMCGNGVRCVGKYAYDHGLVPADRRNMTVETLGGIKTLELDVRDGKAVLITVDMGEGTLTIYRWMGRTIGLWALTWAIPMQCIIWTALTGWTWNGSDLPLNTISGFHQTG